MTTAELVRYEIDVTDIEYIRHGAKPYLARVYKMRDAQCDLFAGHGRLRAPGAES